MSATGQPDDPASILEQARTIVVDYPNDPGWLRAGAYAAAALDLDESTEWFARLTAVAPDDVEAWRGLADARMSVGDDAGAVVALRRVLELSPGDAAVLSDLGHLEHRQTQSFEAITLLNQALEASPGNPRFLRSIIDLHLTKGQVESALQRAEELAAVDPDDVLVRLDIADLKLSMGDYPGASAMFGEVRRLDEHDGHQVFACHGLIEAAARDHQWRPALDAAIDATAVDRHPLTTDLLQFVSAQLFGTGSADTPDPRPWEDLAAELERERAEHRRFHAEQSIS